MKGFSATCCTLALLMTGCASSPPSPTVKSEPVPTPEKTMTTVNDPDQKFVILRQAGGAKGHEPSTESNDAVSKVSLNAGIELDQCPPGQLMATRIITGETGTRITDECVTPFSSKGRRYQQSRPVAIKIRKIGSEFSAETISRK